MARDNWSAMVDCRTADYVVPEDVEITELRKLHYLRRV